MQEESLGASQEDPIIKVYKVILLINVFFFFFVKGNLVDSRTTIPIQIRWRRVAVK